MDLGSNWTCPYCRHAQVLADERVHNQAFKLHVAGAKYDDPQLSVMAVVCANGACKEMTLWAALTEAKAGSRTFYRSPVKRWPLMPPSRAKPQPECVPEPLRADYQEACAIRDLSPKASATIIR